MMSLLQFEWAWQHPAKSRRLGSRISPGKRSRESPLEHRFRILSEMLVVGPWRRLPLTVRWLQQEHCLDFPLDRQPPTHMPIAYGPVELTGSDGGGGGGGGRSRASKKSCSQPSERNKEEEEVEVEVEEGEKGEEEDEGEQEEGCSANVSCYICHQVVSMYYTL